MKRRTFLGSSLVGIGGLVAFTPEYVKAENSLEWIEHFEGRASNMVLSDDEEYLFGNHSGDDTIKKFNAEDLTLLDTFNIPDFGDSSPPNVTQLDYDSGYLYVSSGGASTANNTSYKLDIETFTIEDQFNHDPDTLQNVAVGENYVYYANSDADRIEQRDKNDLDNLIDTYNTVDTPRCDYYDGYVYVQVRAESTLIKLSTDDGLTEVDSVDVETGNGVEHSIGVWAGYNDSVYVLYRSWSLRRVSLDPFELVAQVESDTDINDLVVGADNILYVADDETTDGYYLIRSLDPDDFTDLDRTFQEYTEWGVDSITANSNGYLYSHSPDDVYKIDPHTTVIDPDAELELNTRSFIMNNETVRYNVRHFDGDEWIDVTENATIEVSNEDALNFDNATSLVTGGFVNESVTVTAEYEGYQDTMEIGVGDLSISNIDLMPFSRKIEASAKDTHLQGIFVFLLIGAAASYIARNAFVGLGVLTFGLLLLWIAGYVSTGVIYASLIFLGLMALSLADMRRRE